MNMPPNNHGRANFKRGILSTLTLIGFVISGTIEHSILSPPTNSSSSEILPLENGSRRYCDPPNITIADFESNEDVDGDSYLSGHSPGISFRVILPSGDKPKYRFSWGLLPSYFFATVAERKTGPNRVMGYALLASTAVAFLQQYELMHLVRNIAQYVYGFLVGCLVPPFYQLSVNWFSPERRSSFLSLLSGKYLGYALSEFLLLNVVHYQTYQHYLHFVVALLWFFVWFKLIQNEPNSARKVNETKTTKTANSKLPLLKMLKSRPVWMSIAVIFGSLCGEVAINKGMRLYLKHVYHFDDGYLPGISFMLHFAFALSCGYLVDYLLQIRFVSVTSLRRMVVYISHFIPAGFLFVIGFVGCNIVAPVVIYCLVTMMTGANYAGAYTSPLDLAPRYATVIVSLCFTIRTAGSLFMEYLIPYVLAEEILGSWRFIFSLSSLILLVSSIFFMLRGSGSVQIWNDPEREAKMQDGRNKEQEPRGSVVAPLPKSRAKSIYTVEQKILKVLHVQEPDKFTRVRAYSTSLPNGRTEPGHQNVYRPTNKKRASIS